MPKKVERKSAIDMVSWIELLPDQGGTWGKGIIDTVMAFESQADTTDGEIVQLEADLKVLKDKSAQRRSMALSAARRAEKDAVKLFTAEAMAVARPAAVTV